MGEEASFLREQVLRLNNELARSQNRAAMMHEEGEEAAPWLTSSEHLPPLLSAYDSRISELEQGEGAQRARADRNEAQLRESERDREKIKGELRDLLHTAHRKEEASGSLMRTTGVRSGGAAQAEVEQRLELLYEENNVLTEQNHEMAEELERLRGEKLEQAQQHVTLVKQVGQVREEQAGSEAGWRRATEARDRSSGELQRCVADLMVAQEHAQQAMAVAERHAAERDAAMTSLADYRSTLERLHGRSTLDRDTLQGDLDSTRSRERELQDQLSRTEVDLHETSGREQSALSHLGAMRTDAQAAAEAIRTLEARGASSAAQASQLASELEDVKARVEELRRERERCIARAERAADEVARAEEAARRAEAATKQEVEEVTAALRREALQRSELLQDELRDMELTIGDLNHKIARHHRSRERGGGYALGLAASQGSLAERATSQSVAGVRVRVEGLEAMDELSARLASAERERDALAQQARVSSTSLKAQTDAQAQERGAAAERAEALQRQVRRLEEDTSVLRADNSRLQSAKLELEAESMKALGELSSLRHESVERLRLHQQELDHQTGALRRQLADAREQHERASAEVEQLLASQEAMAAQYRTEARTIAERSEALVQELRAEAERLTVRNAELSAQLSAAVAHGSSLKGSEREEASKVVRLQEELRQCLEGRTQIAAQLSQLRSKEAGWEAERKSLQRHARAVAAAAEGAAAGGAAEGFTGGEGGRECVRPAAAEAGSSGARRVARKRDPKAKAAESAAAEVAGALADARLQAGLPVRILQARADPAAGPSASSAAAAASARIATPAAATPAPKAATAAPPPPAAALARKAPAAALAPLGAPAASGGAARAKLSPVTVAPQ